MFKKISVSFDFGKLIDKLKNKSVITKSQKRRINESIAYHTQRFIESGMVEPSINTSTAEIRERVHKIDDDTTLIRSGNLVGSIRGTEDGVVMVDYGKYQLEGFTMRENNFTKKMGIPTPQFVGPREFIASDQGVDEDLVEEIANEIIDTILIRR